MPFDDKIPPHGDYVELPSRFHVLTKQVIGAAIAVHRQLGPGLPEKALGLLINFNVALLKQGIQRVIETDLDAG